MFYRSMGTGKTKYDISGNTRQFSFPKYHGISLEESACPKSFLVLFLNIFVSRVCWQMSG